MAIGEELSVKVDAATADFTASMERVEDKLEEVADESNSTSRSFGRLSASTSGLTASMGVLGSGLTATAIPAFLTLSTILAPLTVTIGGLAAAAASLGAVFGGLALAGVVTHTSELQSAMQEARQEIIQIIQPLGEVFGPLLVDAVEALPSLVGAIVDSLGPLEQFRDSLVEMGDRAMDLIPEVTEVMFDLAEEALPVLNDALETLEGQGPGVFEELSGVIDDMLPLLVEFGGTVVDVLPHILELGTTVAEVVVPALTDMVDVLDDAIAKFTDLDPKVQRLAISATVLAPVLSNIASALGGLTTIVSAGSTLGSGLASLAGTVTGLSISFSSVTSILTGSGGTVAALGSLSVATGGAAAAVAGLGAAYATNFGNAQTIINQAVGQTINPLLEELRETFEALKSAGETVSNVLIGAWERIDSIVVPIASGIAYVLATVVGGALETLGDAIELVLNLIQGDWDEAWTNVEELTIGTVRGIGTWLLNDGERILKSAVNGIIDGIQNAIGFLLGVGGWLYSQFTQTITNIKEWIGSIGKQDIHNAFEAVGSAIRNALRTLLRVGGDIWSEFTGFVDDVVNYFTSGQAWADMKRMGKNIVGAIISGISTAFTVALSAGGELLSIFAGAVSDILTYVAEGRAYQDLLSVGGAIVDAIIAGVNGLVEGLVGNSVLKDALKEAAETAIDEIPTWMAGIGDAITSTILDGITGLADGIAEKIQDGVEEATDDNNLGGPSYPSGPTYGGDDSDDNGDGDGGDNGGDDADPDISPPPVDDPIRDAFPGVPTRGVPGAQSGGFIGSSGLAVVHEGERVVPASQVSDRGSVEASVDDNSLEPVVTELRAVREAVEQEMDVNVRVESDSGRYDAI